jgi:hypothetical protein
MKAFKDICLVIFAITTLIFPALIVPFVIALFFLE